MLCVHERTIEGENKTCTICFNCFSLQYAVSGKKNYPKSAQNSINSTDLSCICLVSDCKKKNQQMFMKASGSWVLTYLQLVQNCRHI